ncbi:MAG: methylated-DNA--[protein]-cysteine S-methyltransferase [Lachnospiraceae bacterium]|nr:methylated-DNA--[protein]-cysteine S-methyltransferase [Lachnospiraceae bacterium]
MSSILTDELIYEILSVVDEIPKGKVASYGQIARLIGRERNARLVGKVLSMAEYYGTYPCHRVVNHAGRLAPHFSNQKSLLLEDGVTFKNQTHVDMKKCQWNC